jgi:3-hydroxybutyryl-CoA dehydratase
MRQSLRFTAPVRIGDTVTARAEITGIHAEKKRVTLATTCAVGDKVVIEGEALVLVPSRA